MFDAVWLLFLAVLCGGVHGSMPPSTRQGRRSKAAQALKRIRAAERGFFPPANKTQIFDSNESAAAVNSTAGISALHLDHDAVAESSPPRKVSLSVADFDAAWLRY